MGACLGASQARRPAGPGLVCLDHPGTAFDDEHPDLLGCGQPHCAVVLDVGPHRRPIPGRELHGHRVDGPSLHRRQWVIGVLGPSPDRREAGPQACMVVHEVSLTQPGVVQHRIALAVYPAPDRHEVREAGRPLARVIADDRPRG